MVEERAIQGDESRIVPYIRKSRRRRAGGVEADLWSSHSEIAEPVGKVVDEEVASTRAKQSSRGRGTTEYENRLAPRGAGCQSIRLQPHTGNACRFFTYRMPMARLEP
jgi:hypothetical protein